MTIDVRVDFFGIERTVIIGVSTVKDIVRTGFPGFFQPEGKGQAFVVFQIVPGVCLGIQPVDIAVDFDLPFRKFESFSQVNQFAAFICFKSGIEMVTSHFTFDFYDSAGQISVFYRRNTPDDFYLFDSIGRNAAHIDSPVYGTSFPVVCTCFTADVQHIGSGIDRCTVDEKSDTAGSDIVVGTRRTFAGFPQPNRVYLI